MRLNSIALASYLLLAFHPASAQQPLTDVTKDPQALSILEQSASVMSTVPPSDSMATGAIEVVSGSLTQNGSIQILTKGMTESSLQMAMPDETRTIIFANGEANEVEGSTVNVLPLERAVLSQTPDFPLPFISNFLANPDMSFSFVGLENFNGQALYHIRVWDSFASQPQLQYLASFSVQDVWIDSVSALPVRLSFQQRSAQGLAPVVAMDVYYGNYQKYSGTLYPMAIQISVNGTPWGTITIQNVSFNNGLSDSNFLVQ